MRTEAKSPDGREVYARFLACCEENHLTRGLMLRYYIAGCSKQLIFEAIRRYIKNPPDLDEATRKAKKGSRTVLHRAMRSGGPTEFRSLVLSLHDRLDSIYNTKRMGVAHCVESLIWVECYLEIKTGKRPGASELYLLIEAVTKAMGRRHGETSKQAVAKEMMRFKRHKDNQDYMRRLPAKVQESITTRITKLTLLPL